MRWARGLCMACVCMNNVKVTMAKESGDFAGGEAISAVEDLPIKKNDGVLEAISADVLC